jgi:hypothetical protein
MSSAVHTPSAPTLATRRAVQTSAPLPTTLLLTIGSLPLPLRETCTG